MKNIFVTCLLFSITIHCSYPTTSNPSNGSFPDWTLVKEALEECDHQPICPIAEARIRNLYTEIPVLPGKQELLNDFLNSLVMKDIDN